MLFGSSSPQTAGEEKESWSSWLDRAERETWQLELLVSGFAIILLLSAYSAVKGNVYLRMANVGKSELPKGNAFALRFILLAAVVFGITNLVLDTQVVIRLGTFTSDTLSMGIQRIHVG